MKKILTGKLITLAAITAVFLVVLSACKANGKVIVFETNVKGMTEAEIGQIIDDQNANLANQIITIKNGEITEELKFSDYGATYKKEEMVQKALSAVSEKQNKASDVIIPNRVDFDEARIAQKIDDIIARADIKNDKIEIEVLPEESKIFVSGIDKGMIEVNKEKLLNDVNSAIQGGISTEVFVEIGAAQEPNLSYQFLKPMIERQPTDALLVTNPNGTFEITREEVGIEINEVDFNRGIILGQKDGVYEFSVTLIEPKVTATALQGTMFDDVLGELTTELNSGIVGRTTNVTLAANKINGMIMNPGDVFSFNQVVGERTVKAGFKEAIIYSANGQEEGLGGGICQVSSTLYGAVLYADLDVVERKNHKYTVSYAKSGMDATVAFGAIDFRFKNSEKNPIKLVAGRKGNTVTIKILGKKAIDKKVEITTKAYAKTPFGETIEEDPKLEAGKRVVKQKGITGVTVDTFKKVTVNGEVVKNGKIHTSVYRPCNAIITLGTKPAEVEDPVQPTVPTEPTNPTEPTEPTNPTEPTEPTNPTEPTKPTEPEEKPLPPTQPNGLPWGL